MNKKYHDLDRYLNGWLSTALLILAEIMIVYLLSNTPFFLSTLEIKNNPEAPVGFFTKFAGVLQDEINKGQLLSFISALIAPVIFWSLIEFKKALQSKILVFLSLLLLVLSAYLHGKGKEFSSFSSIDLYWGAIFVWLLSILSNRIPPPNNAYFDITENETNAFVEKVRNIGA